MRRSCFGSHQKERHEPTSIVIVEFEYPEALGLDSDDDSVIVPASRLRRHVRVPKPKGWDAAFYMKEWKNVLETLQSWGDAMVEVKPFGVVVGEFIVEPYLITAEQFAVLAHMDMT